MKVMTAQIGNDTDGRGAFFVDVIVVAEGLAQGADTVFIYWDAKWETYQLGFTNAKRKTAPLFKDADLYCTHTRVYDDPRTEVSPFVTAQTLLAACELLGKPAFIQTVKLRP